MYGLGMQRTAEPASRVQISIKRADYERLRKMANRERRSITAQFSVVMDDAERKCHTKMTKAKA